MMIVGVWSWNVQRPLISNPCVIEGSYWYFGVDTNDCTFDEARGYLCLHEGRILKVFFASVEAVQTLEESGTVNSWSPQTPTSL